MAAIRQLGLDIYHNDEKDPLTWDCLAGYEDIKQEIEDTVVMALKNPEAFDNLARKTRCRFESNRPRAVLFEGPPGTGKTLTARIIAQLAEIPMVHIPVESVVSKWYGESEKNLSAIFDSCGKLDGCIVFIDEIDALATERGSGNMHEATRRMLSVLLQMLEGFDTPSKVTLVCATNRKSDLDSALLSRFDQTIRFDLPNDEARSAVFKRYARQLKSKDFEHLSSISYGLSCRDIKEICEHTERKWVAKSLKQKNTEITLPPVDAYEESTKYRLNSMKPFNTTCIDA